ncbi:hypothetical protein Nepgr_030579 [Nepenthes gracilis]|uniref:Uncharacterized protein n=1 Tax=Nepenthes gracilis TaxID=150966 RepID=A0AAD3TGH1_NEPGR|nr:hypothetical protein Nepgr_030579 [Nepenthes gracilis]
MIGKRRVEGYIWRSADLPTKKSINIFFFLAGSISVDPFHWSRALINSELRPSKGVEEETTGGSRKLPLKKPRATSRAQSPEDIF